MTTTPDASHSQPRETIKQEVILQLDDLSLEQLREMLARINALQERPVGMSGQEFVARMREIGEDLNITPEEWAAYDRIMRRADEVEKRRLVTPHE